MEGKIDRIDIKDFGADSSGVSSCTKMIQRAIDEGARTGREVYIPKGTYLIGALFLRSNTSLYLEEGAVLLGSMQAEEYPLVSGRVAGIEMEWPAAILNIRNAEHVRVYGKGTIDGQGEIWWEKYWGKDKKGGMRKAYEQKGLRWAVDYDCFRARNVIVWESSDIALEDFQSKRSGFWNLHLCYSNRVQVNGVQISDNAGPSTDGIDIDSCEEVLVENCKISCNDDNICIKAGRDADGLRVNRCCKNVQIRNCSLLEGEGITIGSETSGGVRDIQIEGIHFNGTKNGFRLKSAKTRGGIIENVEVKHLEMTDVLHPFSFQFNWYPQYSYCKIPESYQDEIPQYWYELTREVPEKLGIPRARNIRVKDVRSRQSKDFPGVSAAFCIEGLEEAPFENLSFENMKLQTDEFGSINHVRNLKLDGIEVR